MLTVDNVAKAYGPTKALGGVSFSAAPGEVFAILGENGAGKSTLLKILAGSVRQDTGTIRLNGEHLKIKSPRDALRQGMVLIPQELAYVPDLTIAENIMLGTARSTAGAVTQRVLRAQAREHAEQLGVAGLLSRRMKDVSLAEAQLVEIAKALARKARVLLLDEPTAALSRTETERLFRTMQTLRARGIVMIYISHRLDEVMEHGDAVMVLRDGRQILERRVAEVTKSELIAGMLGSATQARDSRAAVGRGRVPALEATSVSHPGESGTSDLSFTVAAGEILGFYGVRGAGHEALVESLAGIRPLASGELAVHGTRVRPFRSIRDARKHGIAFVPADRKKVGLVLGATISANLSLPQLTRLSRLGWMKRTQEQQLLIETAARMRLRYRSDRQLVRELSGGNQQKVLVGSRLATSPRILVVHEPTRGVDIGARREIHGLLGELADAGTAVIVATTDIEEAVELVDRLVIVRDGQAVAVLEGSTKTQDRALHEAVEGAEQKGESVVGPQEDHGE